MAKATAAMGFRYAKSWGMTSMPSHQGIEAASQSWEKGAPLKFVAGALTILAETDVTGIAGIALDAATGTTGESANFCPALPNCIFEGEFSDLTDGTDTPTQAIVGADFGINVAGDGNWFIDNDEAGAEQGVTVVGFKDDVGTANPRVFFVFKQATTIFA